MSSDFKILVSKNKNDLTLKLDGECNKKLVKNLIYMLRKEFNCIPKVFIHNHDKNNGHPFDLNKDIEYVITPLKKIT